MFHCLLSTCLKKKKVRETEDIRVQTGQRGLFVTTEAYLSSSSSEFCNIVAIILYYSSSELTQRTICLSVNEARFRSSKIFRNMINDNVAVKHFWGPGSELFPHLPNSLETRQLSTTLFRQWNVTRLCTLGNIVLREKLSPFHILLLQWKRSYQSFIYK